MNEHGEHGKVRESMRFREFKIPPHLLSKLNDDERFQIETVSKLESQFTWTSEQLQNLGSHIDDLIDKVSILETSASGTVLPFIHDQQRINVEMSTALNSDIKPKLNEIWDWKMMLSGKWAIVCAVVIMIVPLLLKTAADFFIKHVTH